jgi:hypothetical protein
MPAILYNVHSLYNVHKLSYLWNSIVQTSVSLLLSVSSEFLVVCPRVCSSKLSVYLREECTGLVLGLSLSLVFRHQKVIWTRKSFQPFTLCSEIALDL